MKNKTSKLAETANSVKAVVSGSFPPLDTYEAIKIYDDMKRKDIEKREAQGYVFTHKKRELYEIGYYDCYESLRRK